MKNIIRIKTSIETHLEKDCDSAILAIDQYKDEYSLVAYYTSGDEVAIDYLSSAIVYFRTNFVEKPNSYKESLEWTTNI